MYDTIDSIIFDCDGVLVDVTKSYDLAIDQTSKFILKNHANILNPLEINSEIIDGFKSSGGFNDEVDVTYAVIISQIAANYSKQNPSSFIQKVYHNADSSGILSVENYISLQGIDISSFKQKLSYPGIRTENLLNKTFDQFFYGKILYEKLFKIQSNLNESGFINNDEVIINQKLISILKSKFANNMAIVTGRGFESIKYSLKSLLNEFNTKNSAFLEDEPREFAKPNPEPLIRSIKGMNSRHCLYVGDSMEDLLMAQKATHMGYKTTFCGITGTSKNPEQKRKLFENNKAQIILKSIHDIPKTLNLSL